MALTHSIIHKIDRPTPGAAIATVTATAGQDGEGPAASLFEQLKRSFQRSSQKQYGCFDSERGSLPLPAFLQEFEQKKLDFDGLSLRLMQQLQSSLEDNGEAFSAHIMFALETTLGQSIIYMFWIPHVDALHINSDLGVSHSQYIDPARMPYGLRIHLDEWREGVSEKYLALMLARGNKPLADSIALFAGFHSSVDLEKDTGEFLDIADRFTEVLPDEKVDAFREQLIEYCLDRDSKGEAVHVEELSRNWDEENPQHFSDYVATHQEEEKPSLHMHRNSLKRYVRFSGRDKNISISFSARLMGDHVQFDPDSEQLVLRQVPKSLREQLKRHLLAEKN